MDELGICGSRELALVPFFGIFQIGPISDEHQGAEIGHNLIFRKFRRWKVAVLFWGKLELPGFFSTLSLPNTYRIKKDRTKSVKLEDTYVAPKNADQGPEMPIFLLRPQF